MWAEAVRTDVVILACGTIKAGAPILIKKNTVRRGGRLADAPWGWECCRIEEVGY